MICYRRKKYFTCDIITVILIYSSFSTQIFKAFGWDLTTKEPVRDISLNVSVYPSHPKTTDFMVYDGNFTWIEAYYTCIQNGKSIVTQSSNGHYKYLKSRALKNGWLPSRHIWLGFVKYEKDDEWISLKFCKTVDDSDFNGVTNGSSQCLLLNMTSANHRETNYYAAPCGTEAGVICSGQSVFVNDTTSVYTLTDNMTLKSGKMHSSENVSTLSDCVYVLFRSCYACYAAEFLYATNSCMVFNMDSKFLPEGVTITGASNYQTLVLKNTHKVFIKDDFSKVNNTKMTFSDLPCIDEINKEIVSTDGNTKVSTQTTPKIWTDASKFMTTQAVSTKLTYASTLMTTHVASTKSVDVVAEKSTQEEKTISRHAEMSTQATRTILTDAFKRTQTQAAPTTATDAVRVAATQTTETMSTYSVSADRRSMDASTVVTKSISTMSSNANRKMLTEEITTLSTEETTTRSIQKTTTESTQETKTMSTDSAKSTLAATKISTYSVTVASTGAPTPITTSTSTKSTETATTMSKDTSDATATPNMCPCSCLESVNNRSSEQILSEIEIRKKELAVKKATLSVNIRAKTSAADNRVSAGYMGYMGAVVLGLVVFFLVIGDVVAAFRFVWGLSFKAAFLR